MAVQSINRVIEGAPPGLLQKVATDPNLALMPYMSMKNPADNFDGVASRVLFNKAKECVESTFKAYEREMIPQTKADLKKLYHEAVDRLLPVDELHSNVK